MTTPVLVIAAETAPAAVPPTQGLALWLRADAGVTRDSSGVSAWADQSGNARNAVQATASARPSFIPDAVGGRPALAFDGTADHLTFDLPVNGLSGMTIFLVSTNTQDRTGRNSGAENAAIFWNRSASGGMVFLSPFQSSVKAQFGTTELGNRLTYTRPASIGPAYSITASRKDGATETIHVDGALVLSKGGQLSTLAANRDTGNIGRGLNDDTFFPGQIAEVLVYTRALSDAERQSVEGYLRGRFLSPSPSPSPSPTQSPPPPSPTAPVIAGAGDIASCGSDNDEATARILDAIEPDRVFTLGDNAYPDGTPEQFANCYHPTWGRHKAITMSSVGNHEYHTGGAAGYFEYFGATAGEPPGGYDAYDVGPWRLYALNSNCRQVECGPGSAQERWLRADLAANPRTCSAAFMHHPRFSSGHEAGRRDKTSLDALYRAFYEAGGDLWLAGHNHQYERLAPLDPAGNVDPARGIRSIIAGTGGRRLYPFGEPRTGSEVRDNTSHGVLVLVLGSAGYEWQFVRVAGDAFADAGTGACHG